MILTLDPEGYPTDECLVSIEKEEIKTKAEALAMLRKIESIWAYANWGWGEETKENKVIFHISTAGWSGNESIMTALKANFIFWSFAWKCSRRGGHYEFEF